MVSVGLPLDDFAKWDIVSTYNFSSKTMEEEMRDTLQMGKCTWTSSYIRQEAGSCWPQCSLQTLYISMGITQFLVRNGIRQRAAAYQTAITTASASIEAKNCKTTTIG